MGRIPGRGVAARATEQVLRRTSPGEKVLSLFPFSDKETCPKCHSQDVAGPGFTCRQPGPGAQAQPGPEQAADNVTVAELLPGRLGVLGG